MKSRLTWVVLLLLTFAFPAHAYSPEFCSNIDIGGMLKTAMENARTHIEDPDKISTGGKIYEALYANRWIVTCAMIYGLENLSEAAGILRSDEFLDVVVSPEELAADELGQEIAGGGSLGISGETIIKQVRESRKENLKGLADTFDKMEELGLSEPLYPKSAGVGLVLVFVCFMARLVWYAYELLTGRAKEGSSWSIVIIAIRTAAILVVLLSAHNAFLFGIDLSNSIRDMIADGPWNAIDGRGLRYVPPGDGTGEGVWGDREPVNVPVLEGTRIVTGVFGEPRGGDKTHKGVDFRASPGDRVMSPVGGRAEFKIDPGGYGHYVRIYGDDGSVHVLAHLRRDEWYEYKNRIDRNSGRVERGTGIGVIGVPGSPPDLGRGTGSHLHWDVKYGGVIVDPQLWLTGNLGGDNPGTDPETPADPDRPTPETVPDSEYVQLHEEGAGSVLDTLLLLRYELAMLDPNRGILESVYKGWIQWWCDLAGNIMYGLAAFAIYILMILGDIMMSITLVMFPLVLALSLLPSFEGYMGHWVKAYITFLFYQPLAAILSLMMFAIIAVTLDAGFLQFALICVLFVYATTRIPNIADSASGAALSGIATTMALLPAMARLKMMGLGVKAAGALAGPAGAALGVGLSGAIDKAGDAANEMGSSASAKGSSSGSRGGRKKK